MKLALKRTAIADSTVACAALFSFSWPEQRGVSMGIESAQAQTGRPWTPLGVAGVARRQHRRVCVRAQIVGGRSYRHYLAVELR